MINLFNKKIDLDNVSSFTQKKKSKNMIIMWVSILIYSIIKNNNLDNVSPFMWIKAKVKLYSPKFLDKRWGIYCETNFFDKRW